MTTQEEYAKTAFNDLTDDMTGEDVARWFAKWNKYAGATYLTIVLMSFFAIKED